MSLSTLSTLPLTDAAMKLPHARALRSLKRIQVMQALQMFQTCRDNALGLRGQPQMTDCARKWARMAREEWAVIRRWLFA